MIEFKEKYSYGGWENCLHVSNGSIELVATTDVGPRIIRFGFSGQQNLFREFENEMGKMGGDDFRLYGGSRFWHAPEANPRTYFPDNEPVEYEWDGKAIRLLQKVESTTGMQKEILIKMDPEADKVSLAYRIYNKNLWDIKLAPWALSIMNLGGRAIIPQEPFQSWEKKLTPARPMVLWGYTAMDDPRWIWGRKYIQLKQDRDAKTRQKIGLLNKQGWAAYDLGEDLFIKRYGFDPDAPYVDYGVNTEIYTDKDILEIETLGRYDDVEPGGCTEHKENWYIFKARPGEDEDSIDSIILPLLEKTELP